jgi:hypothetical protein
MSGAGNKLIVDAMGEIAESANCWVVLKDSTLFLVNRNQDNASVVKDYRIPELLSLEVQLPLPIRRLRAEWTQNIPYANVLRLETQTQESVVEINAYGQDLDLDPLSQVETEVEDFLKAYYEIAKRPTVTALVNGIVVHEIGDRIDVFDYQMEIKAEITINTFSWDFGKEETRISGFAKIYHVQDV